MHAQCTLVLSIFLHGQSLAVVKNIYMLGLFPMEGSWYGGNAVKAAAEVAIDYVSYDANILPGYQLHMIDNDTKVHKMACLLSLSNLLYTVWRLLYSFLQLTVLIKF